MTVPFTEQRATPRISAPVRACVIGADGARSEVPLRDIGMGGLFVYSPYPLAAVGQTLQFEIGTPDGAYFLQLPAEATRHTVRPDSNELLGIAFQFPELTSEQRARLAELLARLLEGPGGDKRAFPRVSARLEVTLVGAIEVKALLKDLSLGGAGLWVDTPLAVGQALTLRIAPKPGELLALPGKVVATRWPKHDEPYGQAGFQFEPLGDAVRARLRKLLDKLVIG